MNGKSYITTNRSSEISYAQRTAHHNIMLALHQVHYARNGERLHQEHAHLFDNVILTLLDIAADAHYNASVHNSMIREAITTAQG